MDEILQAYRQMMAGRPDAAQAPSAIDDIYFHMKDIVPFIRNRSVKDAWQRAMFYIAASEGAYDIRTAVSVECADPVRFMYRASFAGMTISFHAIPRSVDCLAGTVRVAPDLSFYGGPCASPDKDRVYDVYFGQVYFRKQYLDGASKRRPDAEMKKRETAPREQSARDVLLQYMSYFRNR